MRVVALSSGSKGNCYYVETSKNKILLDAGRNYTYIKDKLAEIDISINDIDYIIISHTHTDHISALKTFIAKGKVTIVITGKMAAQIPELVEYPKIYDYENDINLDGIIIDSFRSSHDAIDSRNFIIDDNGIKLGYITDTGYINKRYFNKLTNLNMYLFESNHDIEMLQHGPYPDWLKKRVLSDEGHLSNNTSAFYLTKLIGPNTEKVMLIHLSETNNMPEVALKTLKSTLKEYNIKFSNIEIALQNERSEVTEI